MTTDELPLIELFTRLRQAGLPLGMNEYQLVLQALQSGFGLPNREALAQLCCTLWIKSAEDKLLFNYHFEEVMAEEVTRVIDEDKAILATVKLSPVNLKAELPKYPIIALWQNISLPTRLALGATLVMVTGIALWSVIPKKECPYFTSQPKEFVGEDKKYHYEIKVCKTNPTDKVEIKAIQKHPLLKFQDRYDGTAILTGSNQAIDYSIVSLWDIQGKQLTNFGNLNNIRDISFSPDGQRLLTKLDDETARLWDIQGKQLTNFGNLNNIRGIS
ncbi:MAG: hypothetical protein V7K48_25065, partial [Nostoc sp.]|uniref:WD40 repeat domain-containing protein n=1 Tax=Nostoc sp. TaxID=1180 RepID=UPI0030592B1B